MQSIVRILVVTSITVIFPFLNGCGCGNLTNIKTNLKQGDVNRHQTILVKDFDTTHTSFSGDNATDKNVVKVQKQRIAYDIKILLISKLNQNGFKAYDFNEVNNTDNAIVIEGIVTRINHGSGAWRFMVGFGAGASWMETTVSVYKAENISNILAEFQVQSSSQSNFSPGDLTGPLVKDLVSTIADYIANNS